MKLDKKTLKNYKDCANKTLKVLDDSMICNANTIKALVNFALKAKEIIDNGVIFEDHHKMVRRYWKLK